MHMASVVQPSGLLLPLCSLEIVSFDRILFRTGISTADLSPHVSLTYYSVVLVTLWTYIVICKHCIITWKISKVFNVYMSHNHHKHVCIYKKQYILPVFPLLFLFMTSDLLFYLWGLLELREETQPLLFSKHNCFTRRLNIECLC